MALKETKLPGNASVADKALDWVDDRFPLSKLYSVLHVLTVDSMYVLIAAIAAYVMLIWFKSRMAFRTQAIIAAAALLAVIGMLPQALDAKVWGVALFGSSLIVIAALPWLDHSPLRPIHYRPDWHTYAYLVFGLSLVTLGLHGTQLPPAFTLTAQLCTLLYFSVALLMPWWSAMGMFEAVPQWVTFQPH